MEHDAKRAYPLLLLACGLWLCACSAGGVGAECPREGGLTTPLSAVNDFAYQLQGVDLEELGDGAWDLVVIDCSRDGSEDGRFSPADIAALRDSPGGAKIVLSYMSIGEAETYRWYWQEEWDADGDGEPDADAPEWLGPENPDWEGNYKVRYWSPEWQGIIFEYLDRVIDAGFDGVYLDIIDAFEYWGEGEGEGERTSATAEQDMVDFVRAIARHTRETRGCSEFLVFPQNGEALAAHEEYLEAISGIGREDLWFIGDDPQPAEGTADAREFLDLIRDAGRTVLVIEYPTEPDLVNKAYANALAAGYIPLVTVRGLDTLPVWPGHQPD